MKKYLLLIFISSFMFFLLVTCSKSGFSRSTAAKQIKQTLDNQFITHSIYIGDNNGKIIVNYPGIEFYIPDHKNNELGDDFVNSPNKYISLAEKGLLNYKVLRLKQDDGYKRGGGRGVFYEDWFEIKLTPKGKKYVIKIENRGFGDSIMLQAEVKLAEIDAVDVTGLTEPSDAGGQKMCQANYNAKYKLTPFGEVFNDRVELVRQRTAAFVLYDDGWRLAR